MLYMKTIEEKINDILASWNPINVPNEIAFDEYKAYIPTITNYGHSRNLLFDCLEDIVENKIGSGFDIRNEIHVKDLNKVCDEIWDVIGYG